MKSRWNQSKDQRRLDDKKDKEKEKKYRIYLAEPLDFFGVVQQQKIRERQRLEKKAQMTTAKTETERISWNSNENSNDFSNIPIIGIGTEPTRNLGEEDFRILRRSIYHDQSKKPGGLEAERRPHRRTAISIPLREVLATHIKSCFHRLTRWKQSMTSSSSSANPSMDKSRFLGVASDSPRSMRSLRSTQSRTISTSSSTYSTDSDEFDQYGQRRHVHFAPNTIFCERDEESPFWTNLLHRRRLKAHEKDMNRPRPFLPLLEAGLSYTNDEEFYRLKNISAHKDPQLILKECQMQCKRRRRGKLPPWFRQTFCCILPTGQVNFNDYRVDSSPHRVL